MSDHTINISINISINIDTAKQNGPAELRGGAHSRRTQCRQGKQAGFLFLLPLAVELVPNPYNSVQCAMKSGITSSLWEVSA